MTSFALSCQGRVAARQGRTSLAQSLFREAAAVLEAQPNPDAGTVLKLCRGLLPGASDVVVADDHKSVTVRAAVRIYRQCRSSDPTALHLDRVAHSFWIAPGEVVSLLRRPTLWRTLLCLAERRRDAPGLAVARENLFAAGWPYERISSASAAGRVRSAIYSLRKLGLSGVLSSSAEGYSIHPEVAVELD